MKNKLQLFMTFLTVVEKDMPTHKDFTAVNFQSLYTAWEENMWKDLDSPHTKIPLLVLPGN